MIIFIGNAVSNQRNLFIRLLFTRVSVYVVGTKLPRICVDIVLMLKDHCLINARRLTIIKLLINMIDMIFPF